VAVEIGGDARYRGNVQRLKGSRLVCHGLGEKSCRGAQEGWNGSLLVDKVDGMRQWLVIAV